MFGDEKTAAKRKCKMWKLSWYEFYGSIFD